MADCQPVQNCKSRRCAQAGVCNCLIVYSDGTQVPGSGTGSDPYVIETPPIKAIRDATGNLLTPDQNRIVQLPPYIQKIVSAETGITYQPDSRGRVVLPVNAISTLSFRDVAGNILTVQSDDVITIEMDGEDSAMLGYDTPIVDSGAKTIKFPGFKVYEYSATGISVNTTGANGIVSIDTDVIDYLGPDLNHTYQNNNLHATSIAMQIWHGGNPYTSSSSDYFIFDLFMDYNGASITETIATNVAFTGDKAQSYNTYYFVHQTQTGFAQDMTIRLHMKECQLDSYRKQYLRVDTQVLGQWV